MGWQLSEDGVCEIDANGKTFIFAWLRKEVAMNSYTRHRLEVNFIE